MNNTNEKHDEKKAKKKTEPTDPIDVVDGIPDREKNPPKWKYILIGVLFLLWIAFLVYSGLAGTTPQ